MDEESKRKMSRLIREDNDGTREAAAKEAKSWSQRETDENEIARKTASSNRQAMEARAKKMFEPYRKSPEQENEESGLYSKASAASVVKHDIADSKHLTTRTNMIHNTKDGHGIISRERREAFAKSLENAYDDKKYKEGQGKKK